jgi:hypothetical protein
MALFIEMLKEFKPGTSTAAWYYYRISYTFSIETALLGACLAGDGGNITFCSETSVDF